MAPTKNPKYVSGFFFACLVTVLINGCGNSDDNSSPTNTTPTILPTAAPTSEPSVLPTAEPTVTPSLTPTPSAEPLKPDNSADPTLPAPSDANYHAAKSTARFLTQATFGPTAKSIHANLNRTREQWIDEQFSLPQTRHLQRLDQRLEEIGLVPAPDPELDEEGWIRDLQRSDIWWESAIWGKDQLRQKMAYTLSQILVISTISDVLFNDSRGVANYHDILATHAFGNYRDLLEEVTLSPMMGEYLSMIRNEKANQERNIRPDENYAREIMQLFSIGLVELNIDATPKLDNNNNPIATYGQDDIKALARVFTGWNHGTINQWWEWTSAGDSEVVPMKSFDNYHDNEQKVIFGNQTITANQTPQQDISRALDILFLHPNVGPFVSKQLIQRLITSNPSPEYVSRVATIFNNNGNGVKGDMKAVVKAILLDNEAVNGHTLHPSTFGKLREPILKISALWRAFKAQGVPVSNLEDDNSPIYPNRLRYRGTDREFGQRPYGSFSVFNFYRPDFQQPGAIKNADLNSPEFQIMTDSQLISATSAMSFTIFWRDTQGDWPQSEIIGEGWDIYPTQLYLEEEKAIANNPAKLLDRINLLLMAGQMSPAMYNEILTHLNAYSGGFGNLQIYDALLLVTASPEFAVQR
jgi:Uncharacterized protein conserved in bacteria